MAGFNIRYPWLQNARFFPSSSDGCGRGLGRDKYVEGGEVLKTCWDWYQRGDLSKARQASGWGAKVMFGEIVEMMVKADVGRLEPI